jgi:hypothetical protein
VYDPDVTASCRAREKSLLPPSTPGLIGVSKKRADGLVDWDELGGMGFRICDSLQEFTLKGVLQEFTLKGVALAGATRLRTVFVPMTLSAAFSLPILLSAGLSPATDHAGPFANATLSALGRSYCG